MMNPTDPHHGQIPMQTQQAAGAPPAQTQPVVAQPAQAPVAAPAPTAESAAAPGNSEQNYDFILNPAKPEPKKAFGGNKPLKLLVIVAGAGLILVIILVVLMSLLKPKTATGGLLEIVQRQQEIIRIATQGETQASTEDLKGLSYTIALSVSTNQIQAEKHLVTAGLKLTPERLNLKRAAETDTLLENAKTTSTYDQALRDVLNSQLSTYLTELQTAYKDTDSKNLKTILNSSFVSGKMLLERTQQTNDEEAEV